MFNVQASHEGKIKTAARTSWTAIYGQRSPGPKYLLIMYLGFPYYIF